MARLAMSSEVRQELGNLDEAEFVDESGRRLGYFLSEKLYCRLMYDWANAQISDEELQRRRGQPGGRTLQEIWTRLERS